MLAMWVPWPKVSSPSGVALAASSDRSGPRTIFPGASSPGTAATPESIDRDGHAAPGHGSSGGVLGRPHVPRADRVGDRVERSRVLLGVVLVVPVQRLLVRLRVAPQGADDLGVLGRLGGAGVRRRGRHGAGAQGAGQREQQEASSPLCVGHGCIPFHGWAARCRVPEYGKPRVPVGVAPRVSPARTSRDVPVRPVRVPRPWSRRPSGRHPFTGRPEHRRRPVAPGDGITRRGAWRSGVAGAQPPARPCGSRPTGAGGRARDGGVVVRRRRSRPARTAGRSRTRRAVRGARAVGRTRSGR